MRNFILLFVVFGAVIFSSCKKGPETVEPEIREPFWRETYRYFDGRPYIEFDDEGKVLESRVDKYSVYPNKERAYEMTLLDDGTGWGSGPMPNSGPGIEAYRGRYDFDLTWTMSEDKFTLTIIPSKSGSYDGIALLFGEEFEHVPPRSTWNVEEYTDDKLVLSVQGEVYYDTDYFPFTLLNVYRWTFEKVEPEE